MHLLLVILVSALFVPGLDAQHPQAGIRWWLEAMRETYGAWKPPEFPPDGQIVIDPKHPALADNPDRART